MIAIELVIWFPITYADFPSHPVHGRMLTLRTEIQLGLWSVAFALDFDALNVNYVNFSPTSDTSIVECLTKYGQALEELHRMHSEDHRHMIRINDRLDITEQQLLCVMRQNEEIKEQNDQVLTEVGNLKRMVENWQGSEQVRSRQRIATFSTVTNTLVQSTIVPRTDQRTFVSFDIKEWDTC